MANPLPGAAADCCVPVCDDEVLVQVPGPAGADGVDGADGTDGDYAYSPLLAGFTMPAEGATVEANLDSGWMAIGQNVFVQFAGTMQVTAKADSTHATLKNLEDTAAGLYTENAPAGTAIPIGVQVAPAGLQGPAGSAGGGAPTNATYITQTPDGTLTNEQAMSALATGYVKNATGTGILTSQAVPVPVADGGTGGVTAAAARTALSAAPSTATFITQTVNAELSAQQVLSTLATGYMKVTTGTGVISSQVVPIPVTDGGTGGATAATARSGLGVNRTLQDYLLYQHQLAAGTDAGTFDPASGWGTVPLNTEVADTGGHGSIAANTITLATGTYRVRWRMCGYQVDRFQSRLFNVTTAGIIALGSNAKSPATDTGMAYSCGEGRITIAAATEDIRLQAQCETVNATDGFGIANAFGGTQVYAAIELEREAG